MKGEEGVGQAEDVSLERFAQRNVLLLGALRCQVCVCVCRGARS